MSDIADLSPERGGIAQRAMNESASDTGTETIKQDPPKPKADGFDTGRVKRKCTPAQLEVLKRNREKALEVIRQKGEKARLQKELKDRYKQHVDTERDAEIERLKAALGKKQTSAKPAARKSKRAPSPSSSESDESPPPPPKRKAKKKRKPATPSETSSSEDGSIDPAEASLQALHRRMFPFG